MDFAEDLYSKKIIEEDTFDNLQDTYEFSKNHDYEREKDDLKDLQKYKFYDIMYLARKNCIK